MINVIYKTKRLTLAQNWSELTAARYIKAIKLLHQPVKNEWYAADEMLRIISGYSWLRFYLMPADMRLRCYEYIKWVFEKQDNTDQLITKYRGLYGPAAAFNNLKLKEFHHTEIFYQDYIKGDDITAALNSLVATLYREPKNKKQYDYKRDPDGDLRKEFNANLLPYYENKIARWPLAVRLAIVTWYDACRQQIFSDYGEAFTSKTKQASYAQGLFEMMRSISGGKYGSFKEVEELYVHTAFLEIIASKREAQEMEKQYKKQTA